MTRTITTLLVLTAFSAAALGKTIAVPKDAATIGAAIAVALPYDEIEVASGTYPESLVFLNRGGLTLTTKGAVLLQAGATPIRIVDSWGIRIHGFEIRGLGPQIEAIGSREIVIESCTFRDSKALGVVRLENCEDSLVRENTFLGCRIGLDVEGGSAVSVHGNEFAGKTDKYATSIRFTASGSVLSDNLLKVKSAGGVAAAVYLFGASNLFEGNRIKQPSLGVEVRGSGHTLVENRSIGTTLFVAEGSGHVVIRNDVRKASISVSGSTSRVIGNSVRGGGISVTGADNAIERNKVRKAEVAFTVSGSQHRLISNVALKSGEAVVDPSGPGNHVYLGNSFAPWWLE